MLNSPASSMMSWTLTSNVCDQIPLIKAENKGACLTESQVMWCLVWEIKRFMCKRTPSHDCIKKSAGHEKSAIPFIKSLSGLSSPHGALTLTLSIHPFIHPSVNPSSHLKNIYWVSTVYQTLNIGDKILGETDEVVVSMEHMFCWEKQNKPR